jgi:hypothetical protein
MKIKDERHDWNSGQNKHLMICNLDDKWDKKLRWESKHTYIL